MGLVLAIGVPCCGLAQFFGMATPADGSRLYFATPSRVKASGQNPYGKIFQYDANGLRLVAARDPVPLPSLTPPFGGAATNAFDLGMADTSSDGQVTAFGAQRHCAGSDVVLCSKQELFSTTITANGQSRDYPGMLRLSANGQWAFGAGSQSNAVFFRTLGYRVNLATGDTRSIQSDERPRLERIQVSNTSRTVSDTGSAVFFDSRNIYVLQGDQISAMPTLGIAFDAVIDAAADKIVFSSGGPVQRTLVPDRAHRSPHHIARRQRESTAGERLRSEHDGRWAASAVPFRSDRFDPNLHDRNGWSGRPAADQRGGRDHARHRFGRWDGLVCRNRKREIDPDCNGGGNGARVDSVYSVLGNVIQCGIDLFDGSAGVGPE